MVCFDEDEAYALFLILDTLARDRRGTDATVMHLRERTRRSYSEWHKAHQFEVHPPLDLASYQ